jgi:thiamine pyrophosphate-dependent acetolactate synthase large subunit-like protein
VHKLAVAGVGVSTEQEFVAAMEQAFITKGPSLIDVSIDPTGYPEQLKAMRQ